jgi:hypothetical protein
MFTLGLVVMIDYKERNDVENYYNLALQHIVTLGTTNPFTGQTLITLPVMTLAARNNRILNVTYDVWADAQKQATGQWQQLVEYVLFLSYSFFCTLPLFSYLSHTHTLSLSLARTLSLTHKRTQIILFTYTHVRTFFFFPPLSYLSFGSYMHEIISSVI